MQSALAVLEAQVADLSAKLAASEAENVRLRNQVDYLVRQLFGRKSEKVDPRQLELLLQLAARGGADIPLESSVPRRAIPAPGRPRPARQPRLPENLPTEEIVIDPEEVKQAPEAYQCIGQEVTQQLEVIPPRYIRKRPGDHLLPAPPAAW